MNLTLLSHEIVTRIQSAGGESKLNLTELVEGLIRREIDPANPERRAVPAGMPSRPWVVSNQYGMMFVLSQNNEIIIGAATCKKLGESVCRHIVASVNE